MKKVILKWKLKGTQLIIEFASTYELRPSEVRLLISEVESGGVYYALVNTASLASVDSIEAGTMEV
jgi:hypothetical protein